MPFAGEGKKRQSRFPRAVRPIALHIRPRVSWSGRSHVGRLTDSTGMGNSETFD
jgi:hypothetical protein